MNWKKEHQREKELSERDDNHGIAGEGELEIEYTVIFNKWQHDRVDLDFKCTISYKYWSIDTYSVDIEWGIIGSANYLPSDFEQLIRDYLYELPELKGQGINQLTKI